MTTQSVHKPIPLRIIFILNALMAVLPFVFYYVFTTQGISKGSLDPVWMIYTGFAYIGSFALLVYFLFNRKLLGARLIFLANILIALPTGAYIGIFVALVSLALSTFNKKVQVYFSS